MFQRIQAGISPPRGLQAGLSVPIREKSASTDGLCWLQTGWGKGKGIGDLATSRDAPPSGGYGGCRSPAGAALPAPSPLPRPGPLRGLGLPLRHLARGGVASRPHRTAPTRTVPRFKLDTVPGRRPASPRDAGIPPPPYIGAVLRAFQVPAVRRLQSLVHLAELAAVRLRQHDALHPLAGLRVERRQRSSAARSPDSTATTSADPWPWDAPGPPRAANAPTSLDLALPLSPVAHSVRSRASTLAVTALQVILVDPAREQAQLVAVLIFGSPSGDLLESSRHRAELRHPSKFADWSGGTRPFPWSVARTRSPAAHFVSSSGRGPCERIFPRYCS